MSSSDFSSSGGQADIYRILDANANRAGEAVRVVEEFVRFVTSDAEGSRRLKQLRHDLAAAVQQLSLECRLSARNTPQDVGTQITTEAEQLRRDDHHVAIASWKRLQQSLRALEEYSKALPATQAVAAAFESLRYRCYSLEKDLVLEHGMHERQAHLSRARFYLLVSGGTSFADLQKRVKAVIQAGAQVIQLRDKTLSDRDLVDHARALRDVIDPPTLLIVNDRPDVALLADADGVHLGQEEIRFADARRLLGNRLLIGVSTHDLQQARAAVEEGADYIGCGPTFPSSTKTFDAFPGLEFLRQVAGHISIPAFAIGGITTQRLPEVWQTGMRRIAVSGAVWGSDDPAEAMRRLVDGC